MLPRLVIRWTAEAIIDVAGQIAWVRERTPEAAERVRPGNGATTFMETRPCPCYPDRMLKPASIPADQAAEARIYPDMTCFVADDAEFRAAVEAGIASARAGRVLPLDQVEAELQQIFHGPG